MSRPITPALFCALIIGLTMSLVRADEPTTAPAKGSITGTVTRDGKPVAGAMVRIMKPFAGRRNAPQPQAVEPKQGGKLKGAGGKGAAAREAVGTAVTDAEGHFTISDIPAGEYMAGARIKGEAVGIVRVHVVAGQTASVDIQLRDRAPRNGPSTANDKPQL